MRESPIEKHLRKCVKAAGGKAYKWVSPGENGVPDRIVFFPGMVFLVETKRTDVDKLRPLQSIQKRELAKMGFEVVVLNSKEKVEDWVNAQARALYQGRDHISLRSPGDDAYAFRDSPIGEITEDEEFEKAEDSMYQEWLLQNEFLPRE